MRKIVTILCFIFANEINAQPWMEEPYMHFGSLSDSAKIHNFYAIKDAFELYKKDHLKHTINSNDSYEGEEAENEECPGELQYKRWEWFMEPRVFPSGDISLPSKNWEEFQKYVGTNTNNNRRANNINNSLIGFTGNWTELGPFNVPSINGGIGRINFIRFDPTNSNNIWVGTPNGGLWKTNDSGITWSTNTDFLTVVGCADVVIDPTNVNIMYLATGDAEGLISSTNSIGVLKSTDGGATWNTTGLIWPVIQYRRIHKLLINPNNSNIIIAATSSGIYRTTDAGASWFLTQSGSFTDIEFKPSDPTIVYAVSQNSSSTLFYKSTNTGASYVNITSGLPASASVNRFAIGVSDADSNYVYILAVSAASNGFYGLYRSTDGGNNFSLQSNTPNIIGIQGLYHVSIAVNPSNANEVFVGGVIQYRSADGGVTWTQLQGGYHVDIHALEFLPGSSTTIFSGNDGGIFKSTNNGTSWTNLSSGLVISQMYRLGTSTTNPNLNITGLQDNSTMTDSSGIWKTVYMGGDGMECIIDYTNANIMYAGNQYGGIAKSTNGGTSFSPIVNTGGSGINANGSWVTPYVMNPQNSSTLLVGKSKVYRSRDAGATWSQVDSLFPTVKSLAYSISDTNYIYAACSNKFFVSTDGNTFIDRTGTLPVSAVFVSYIAVSNADPNKVWVTFSGYSSGNKVYFSSDAGVTWSNYSTGLPNLPANCIVYQNGSNDGLYLGMDVGVYYRDSSMISWQLFNTGLPNVVVDELEIQYGVGKIRAATYGRGLWEADLYPISLTPVANFTASHQQICQGDSIVFTDASSNSPTFIQWVFTGGTPSVSNLSNPTISYNTPGVYSVELSVTNNVGADSVVLSNFITVNSLPSVNSIALPFPTVCESTLVTLSGTGATTYVWTGGITNAIAFSPSSTQTYTVTGIDGNGCTNTATSNIILNSISHTTINAATCNSYTLNSQTYTASGTYNQTLTNINGCDSIVTLYLLVNNPSTSTINIAACYSYTLDSQTYSTSGTYSQTLFNSNGCDSLVTLNLTINPPAPIQPPAILGITQVCEGSSTAYAVLNDSTATSYTWSLPPTWSGSSDSCLITATADSLGGVITVIANNGCGSSPPQSINVYGSARPIVTLSPLGTVCENLVPFPLTNGNPPGGTYSGIGENSNIFYPYVAGVGTYYITYTYISGACTVSDSVPITVDLCLNVTSNTEESNGITISPNPFTSETTITFNKEQLNTTIKVIDVTGREIKNLEQIIHNTTHTTLDMRGYAKGVYILPITDDNKNTTNKKVIIE